MVDQQEVTATLMQFADTLVSDYLLLDYLDRLLERAAGVVAAAAGGVMLSSAGGGAGAGLQLLACTDEHARVLALFELQRQEGPCIDSHRSGEPVIAEDLATTDLWPQFTPIALQYGYRAVFAFPMQLRGQTIGVLNLFREAPGCVAPDDAQAAKAFADMATIGILQQRARSEAHELAGHLRTALNSRIVIEQAKGILTERIGCELDQAYQLIRWYGRSRNRQLRHVAADVVSGRLRADELTSGAGPSP